MNRREIEAKLRAAAVIDVCDWVECPLDDLLDALCGPEPEPEHTEPGSRCRACKTVEEIGKNHPGGAL